MTVAMLRHDLADESLQFEFRFTRLLEPPPGRTGPWFVSITCQELVDVQNSSSVPATWPY
jgi:hypothetical protein